MPNEVHALARRRVQPRAVVALEQGHYGPLFVLRPMVVPQQDVIRRIHRQHREAQFAQR